MKTATLPNGETIKFNGAKEVSHYWFFTCDNGGYYVSGFSSSAKAATATAKKRFQIYTNGGHPTDFDTIEIMEAA